MDKPSFHIVIDGDGVSPETTAAGDLAELLQNFEAAVKHMAQAQNVELPDDALVSLVGVGDGSNRLRFAVPPVLAAVVQVLPQAVASGNYEQLPAAAHEALHKVSRQAVKKNWKLSFEGGPSLKMPPVTISSDFEVPPPPAPPLTRGTTTIIGRCVSVGGENPHARIRPPHGKPVTIDVSEELARQLARSLYDVVCVEGTAIWQTETMELQKFKAARVTPYQQTDPVLAFEQLSKAAGDRWDNVDVEEYVRSVRYGDDQT